MFTSFGTLFLNCADIYMMGADRYPASHWTEYVQNTVSAGCGRILDVSFNSILVVFQNRSKNSGDVIFPVFLLRVLTE